ncbi:MAG TPA: DUF5686 family protein, partial [Candidatus Acidoferrum sp.]|nr:DUF5686 family protein [Candidatus Acidoferrum sp.]
MSARVLLISVIGFLVAVCPLGRAQTPPSHTAISGTIYDSTSGQPIPYATVQIVGTGRSTLANDDGQYRLLVGPGTYQVKFSHVSHYSLTLSVTVADSVLHEDIYLRPSLIEVKGIRVFDKAYDPAQQIILDAIARKKQMLEKLQSYKFDAYLKVAVRNAAKPESTNVLGIIESQMSAFWERPNKYKEIILARRQTANIPEGTVLTSLGDILDIYRDRNPFGNEEIVSPVAGDALDHYNYYLLDTIVVDGRRVLVLEIEPKRPEEPAYAGQIQIADSSYGVVSLDVKVQRALSEMGVKNIHFTQHFTEYQGEYWMPVEGRFWLNVNLNFPGLPSNIAVEAVTSFHNFTFDTAAPKGTFNQYALEVAPDADKVDSAAWDARQTIPLTNQENRDYQRMDSIVHNRPVGQKIAAGVSKVLFGALYSQDMFRFNRVEGAYGGLPLYFDHLIPRTSLQLKTGYAFDGKYWEHDYSFTTTLQHRPKLELTGGFHDRIVSRPTIIASRASNNSLWALVDQWDPLDYYLEKGFHLAVLASPLSHLQTSIAYNDCDQ